MSVWNAMLAPRPIVGRVLYSGKPPLTFDVALLLLLTFVPTKCLRRVMSTNEQPATLTHGMSAQHQKLLITDPTGGCYLETENRIHTLTRAQMPLKALT